jgi:hypothetical protein
MGCIATGRLTSSTTFARFGAQRRGVSLFASVCLTGRRSWLWPSADQSRDQSRTSRSRGCRTAGNRISAQHEDSDALRTFAALIRRVCRGSVGRLTAPHPRLSVMTTKRQLSTGASRVVFYRSSGQTLPGGINAVRTIRRPTLLVKYRSPAPVAGRPVPGKERDVHQELLWRSTFIRRRLPLQLFAAHILDGLLRRTGHCL